MPSDDAVRNAQGARIIGLRDSAAAMLAGAHDENGWRRFARRVVETIDVLDAARGSSQAGSAPAEPPDYPSMREALQRVSFLLSSKSRWCYVEDHQWHGAPFTGDVHGYRREDMEEIRSLIGDALSNNDERGAGSAGSPEPSASAIGAAMQVYATRREFKYMGGDERTLWHRSLLRGDIADILGAAYQAQFGAASPSSGEPEKPAPSVLAQIEVAYAKQYSQRTQGLPERSAHELGLYAVWLCGRAAGRAMVIKNPDGSQTDAELIYVSPEYASVLRGDLSGGPPTDTEIYTKLAEDYAGALREIAGLEARVREWREAEQSLSDAYVRLRSKLAPWGAWKTPDAPTREQVWETAERALDALMLDLEKALGGSSGEGREPK